MQLYASTFPAGFKDVIPMAMKPLLKDAKIVHIDETVVLYETGVKEKTICDLPCFSNTFLVFDYDLALNNHSIGALAQRLIKTPFARIIEKRLEKKPTTFRFMAWSEGTPQAIEKQDLTTLETNLGKKNVLIKNRTNPQIEIALHARRGGWGFTGLRLTRPSWEDKLKKKKIATGLSDQIAYLIAAIAAPQETDVVLDPCAGNGTIPSTLAIHFPAKTVIATDLNEQAVHSMKVLHRKIGKRLVIDRMDALTMTEVPDGSIDMIVTDPPWGLMQEIDGDIALFYQTLLSTFGRVLKSHGTLVLLSAQKDIIEQYIHAHPDDWVLHNKWNILVNGKKAGVYKLQTK